jgi:hypothetical protein
MKRPLYQYVEMNGTTHEPASFLECLGKLSQAVNRGRSPAGGRIPATAFWFMDEKGKFRGKGGGFASRWMTKMSIEVPPEAGWVIVGGPTQYGRKNSRPAPDISAGCVMRVEESSDE